MRALVWSSLLWILPATQVIGVVPQQIKTYFFYNFFTDWTTSILIGDFWVFTALISLASKKIFGGCVSRAVVRVPRIIIV